MKVYNMPLTVLLLVVAVAIVPVVYGNSDVDDKETNGGGLPGNIVACLEKMKPVVVVYGDCRRGASGWEERAECGRTASAHQDVGTCSDLFDELSSEERLKIDDLVQEWAGPKE